MKLSKAQTDVLVQAVSEGQFCCIENYRPALKLIELGLAEWKTTSRYGHSALIATEPGRLWAKSYLTADN